MIQLVEKGTHLGKIAKTVMEEMYRTGKTPEAIVQEKGLIQISNTGELEGIVDSVILPKWRCRCAISLRKTGVAGFSRWTGHESDTGPRKSTNS
jgi:Asp-tRNA(Asn)/Glu-tRNA(Gln) amidotransferase B subunit